MEYMINWSIVSDFAVTAGTSSLALITYLTLRELQTDRKAKMDRDIRDKICDPYLRDLELIRLSTKVLMQGSTSVSPPPRYWEPGIAASTPYFASWEVIRKEYPFLAKKMEKKKQAKNNIHNIGKFAKHCEKFSDGVGVYKDDLFRIYKEEEKTVIPQLTSFPEWVTFTARTSVKSYFVGILELIFLGKTFDQWLDEKMKAGIHLIDKKFIAGAVEIDKKTFEAMYNAMKESIESSPQLREFLKENREIFNEAELLEKIIRKIRNRLEIY